MKTAIVLLLALATASFAQTGTIVKVSNTVVTATAGTTQCVFTGTTPQAATGIHTTCTISGANVLTQDAVIPVGSATGITGSFNPAAGAITWILTQATAGGPVTYSIAATPSGGTTASGSGNF